jgi:acyl-coenzyme A synthetase/AMP-(fatty) acid ligase
VQGHRRPEIPRPAPALAAPTGLHPAARGVSDDAVVRIREDHVSQVRELDALDALVAHCREHLAGYKVPRRITFVAAMPRDEIGKVSRRRVRDSVLSDPRDSPTPSCPHRTLRQE